MGAFDLQVLEVAALSSLMFVAAIQFIEPMIKE